MEEEWSKVTGVNGNVTRLDRGGLYALLATSRFDGGFRIRIYNGIERIAEREFGIDMYDYRHEVGVTMLDTALCSLKSI